MPRVSDTALSSRANRLLTRAPELLLRAWNTRLLKRKWVIVALILLLAVLSAARCFAALIASEDFTTDAFMVFDGAWRILNGQRPHIDFYSHVGVLTFVPEVIGLWIARG